MALMSSRIDHAVAITIAGSDRLDGDRAVGGGAGDALAGRVAKGGGCRIAAEAYAEPVWVDRAEAGR